MAQVRRLVERGHREVVLTGTQLGSYGFDIPEACLADNYVRVAIRSDEPLANRNTNVTLEELRGGVLWGSTSPRQACATPME